jgi:uncharacterized protein (DUF1015 family)
MADVRPFRALRYDPGRVDLSRIIAPPYDVISPEGQRDLYARSAENIVRIEYGEQRPGDDARENRYTRAARDLRSWRDAGVLVRDAAPALYAYRQEFSHDGRSYARDAVFAAVRLTPWDEGAVKPHEHTLANPKADRLELLRATRTQVSPVYSLYRHQADPGRPAPMPDCGAPLLSCEADGQRHTLWRIDSPAACDAFAAHLAQCDVYIADGHHRYETALAYRDEARARAATWSGEEPENFVLMALTHHADAGLLVLPTHRVVTPPSRPAQPLAALGARFDIEDVTPPAFDADAVRGLLSLLAAAGREASAFVAVGLEGDSAHLLTLSDRAAVEASMPAGHDEAWRRLDVNVLQYGVLAPVFGIGERELTAGGAVSYTQDASEAIAQARAAGGVAFLLNATPVAQVLAVAAAGGRMPQKSTYFYPKLPTGLVMNLLAE